MRRALKGNPTILLLRFTPDVRLVQCDSLGHDFVPLCPQIISRRVQGPYFGYRRAQKKCQTGQRGQTRIRRPELEELCGFDTKYAMHMLRLGFQGMELPTDRTSEPPNGGLWPIGTESGAREEIDALRSVESAR